MDDALANEGLPNRERNMHMSTTVKSCKKIVVALY